MLWHYVEHVPCTPGARAERAFGTRFARAAPEPTRRAPGLASTAEPRHARPSSPQHAKPQPPATSPTGQELAATAADSPCSVQRRPSLFRSPPGPWNSASSSTSVSASARRRHDALATEWRSPATLSAAATEPPCHAYKRRPRASPSTQATSGHPNGAPLPHIRPGEASFLISGNSCRRHRPGQSGTSSISHSPFSPPRTSSSSREPFPLLDFDREPTPPQSHFATEAFLRRGARRRQLTPSPPTQQLPGGPPQPYGSIPTLGGPRGAAKRRRRSPEPRSARTEEGDDARRLVKHDQWARRAHCQRHPALSTSD